jgi:hypothetical protein
MARKPQPAGPRYRCIRDCFVGNFRYKEGWEGHLAGAAPAHFVALDDRGEPVEDGPPDQAGAAQA